MERASASDPPAGGERADRTDLGDALGTTDVSLVRYRLAPGEGLPSGLHAHADQEEVFLVRAGTVTFEHYVPGDPPTAGSVTVEAGEAVRFPPGEYQSGRNAGEEPCVVLALGAPRDTEAVRLPLPCPDCGHPELRLDTDGGVAFACPGCGAEHVPAPCPDCGGEDLGATLDEGATPVAECADCGAQYREPPVRE